VNAPTLMLGLARALGGLGRYVEAQETYNRIIREGVSPGAPEVFKRALAEAKKEVDGVGLKIGGVTITVHATSGADVPNAKVLLDGTPVSTASLGVRRAIDPGSHVLQVSGDGFKPAELHFDVAAGGSVDQPVTLEAEASATPPAGPETTAPGAQGLPTSPAPEASVGGGGRRVLPWVAFGVGAVGLGVGGVTGFMAIDQHSNLANRCTPKCPPSAQSDIDNYDTIALVSTIGFIAGGVGVAAGAILLFTQPKAENSGAAQPPRTALRIVPVVGLGSIGAAGEF
jgi:hypothetical protein